MSLPGGDLRSRCELLRSLHRPGTPLLLPNAWDVPTARAVAAAGFPVVATTSFGVLSDAEMFGRAAIDPVSNEVTWGAGLRIDPEVLYRDLMSKAAAALH